LSELPPGKKAATNFPFKLHQILSTPEYEHIISWMPHGRAWKIHNKDLLMRKIVPKYFVQSKYESFTRQLNGWGFKRLHQSGNDFNAYYHVCFLRGIPHLTVLMTRVAPYQGRLLPHMEGEPNFYEIETRYPLPPPIMPYHDQHPYPYSPMAGASYRAPPELPMGYSSPSQYSPYTSNFQPPPSYYHGHHGDTTATGPYAPQSSFPQYSHYPPQPQFNHTQSPEHYRQYPHSAGPQPPGLNLSQYHHLTPNNDIGVGPVRSEEVSSVPAPQGAGQEEQACHPTLTSLLPIKAEAKEYSIEPLSVFTELENAAVESALKDFGQDVGK